MFNAASTAARLELVLLLLSHSAYIFLQRAEGYYSFRFQYFNLKIRNLIQNQSQLQSAGKC